MKRFYNERASALLLLLAAIWIGGFVNTIEFWTILYAKARTGLASTEAGYLFNQFLIAAISIVVLGIPAGLLGAVLPLCIGIVSGAANALGDQVGRLLTWNTLGAVAGVLGTGFLLMPTVGLRGALLTLAILLSLVALLSFRAHRAMPGVGASAMVAGLLLWMVFSGDALWRHVLASGIFRLRANHVDWDSIRLRAGAIKLLFYKDAADATVSVETTIRKREKEDLVLRINGKPDASTVGDISTQYLLAHLPMMARPQATDVFVLGFGSGITAGALLEHPIAHLTIAENCQPILDAAPLFEPWNRGVLTNSRTRLYMEDARTVLKLSPKAYDVIISEPSNPWVAGIGSVFSREFYELAAGRLKDGGVMAQWFHIYEMHDGIVFLVLRTFGSVFPHMEIWDTLEGDMVILGSKTQWKSSPEIYRQVYERGGVKRDLETLGLGRPELVWARQIASQATAPFIAGEGPIQSDGFPLLEYIAPEAFYVGAHARQIFYFDERTWQSVLASEEKRKTLAALPDEMVNGIFANFGSCNQSFSAYMKWRVRHRIGNEAHPVFGEDPLQPMIFRPPMSYPSVAETSDQATAELRQLLNAQALLLSQPNRANEALESMRTVLTSYASAAERPADVTPLVGHFVSLLARTHWMHGDAETARGVVEFGLKLAASDPQLHYLQRVMAPKDKIPL
jgi:spermidine synthase